MNLGKEKGIPVHCGGLLSPAGERKRVERGEKLLGNKHFESKAIVNRDRFANGTTPVGLKCGSLCNINFGVTVVVGCGLLLGRAVVVMTLCVRCGVPVLVFHTMRDIETGQLLLAVMMMRHHHKRLRGDAHHRQNTRHPTIYSPCHQLQKY
jgi:hypothetical protein